MWVIKLHSEEPTSTRNFSRVTKSTFVFLKMGKTENSAGNHQLELGICIPEMIREKCLIFFFHLNITV